MKKDIIPIAVLSIIMLQAFFAGAYWNEEYFGDTGRKIKAGAVTVAILFLGFPGLIAALPMWLLVFIWVRLNRYFSISFFVKHVLFKRPIKGFDEEIYQHLKKKYDALTPKWYQFNRRIDKKINNYIAARLDQIKGNGDNI